MFYSAQTGGFYDCNIHGARLIAIQDPTWIRPKVDVVVQPGEATWVGDELMTNTGDEPITLHNILDMSAIADTLEVANPACLIPEDAVEIPNAHREELLAGQSLGKVIAADERGYPILIDPPPMSAEDTAAAERVWRDARLAATDGVVSRHRDELEEGSESTLTAAQYLLLQAYRRALRNWPESGEFPLMDHRPLAPPWLSEQAQ
ncbi:MAG: phage tail assembly chaperone [Pseudomonas sp.]